MLDGGGQEMERQAADGGRFIGETERWLLRRGSRAADGGEQERWKDRLLMREGCAADRGGQERQRHGVSCRVHGGRCCMGLKKGVGEMDRYTTKCKNSTQIFTCQQCT